MRTKLEIPIATSMYNGIRFYSKKGYVVISTVDEQGVINTKRSEIKKYEKGKNKHNKIENMKKFIILILKGLPSKIIFIILFIWLMNKNPILGIRFLFIGYAFIALSIFAIDNFIERKREKNVFKFHSAKHMLINAYRKLKRVPSLEEIREYSRFDNDCSTNLVTQTVISFVLMFFVTFISNSFYSLIGIIVSNTIVLILLQCSFLNFLQKWTTIVPTDRELSVAIAGLNAWIENEKKGEGEV